MFLTFDDPEFDDVFDRPVSSVHRADVQSSILLPHIVNLQTAITFPELGLVASQTLVSSL